MSRQKQGVRLNSTDFYPTPSWCYKNLEIDWTQFESAHEPCRGDGRISDWLGTYVPTTYSEIREGKDFFDWTEGCDLILTNPPFGIAQEFIDHSIAHAQTVIMLLRINYLGSISRHEWWKQNAPTSLFVLSKRPSFTGMGTDATDYAWYVWDKTDRIATGVHFVAPPTREQGAEDNAHCKQAVIDALQAALQNELVDDKEKVKIKKTLADFGVTV